MSYPAIRYSPSGAIIAEIGAGMQLRLSEAAASFEFEMTAGLVDLPDFTVFLPDPKGSRSYRATMQFSAESSAGGNAAVQPQRSLDGGATWHNVGFQQQFVVASGTSRTVRMEVPMQLGSGANWDIAPNEPHPQGLLFRALVGGADVAISANPDTFLSLAELL